MLKENQHPENIPFESVTIKNDFMFGAVMSDPEICRKFLSIVLDKPVEKVEYVGLQTALTSYSDIRFVRLDVYVRGEDEVFNVEMQVENERDLPWRMRYYGTMVDNEQIKHGTPYSSLKPTYIIFVCAFDYFKKGRSIYTFENRCLEDPELSFGDMTTKIVINTATPPHSVNDKLASLIRYINDGKVDSDFTKELDEAVGKIHESEEWRRSYMLLLARDQEKRLEGKLEGLKEGLKEGKKEGKKEAQLTSNIATAKVLAAAGTDFELIKKACPFLSDDQLNSIMNSK